MRLLRPYCGAKATHPENYSENTLLEKIATLTSDVGALPGQKGA